MYIAIACVVCIPILFCMLGSARPTGTNGLTSLGAGHVEGSANDPVLSAPGLNATFGYANITTFNFTITYQSSSNTTPSYVNLTVIHENWTANYTMQNATENYSAGVQYHVTIILPRIGNYSHYFTASNGTGLSRFPSTGSFAGPSVIWLRNYTMTEIPFRWFNPNLGSNQSDPYLNWMYNYNLNYQQTMYEKDFRTVQVSLLGFTRFSPLTISEFNRYPVNMSSTDPRSAYTLISVSGKVWDQVPGGDYTYKYFVGQDYFFVSQTLTLNNSDHSKTYNASFEYIVYRNGTLILSYDYVRFDFPLNETIGVNRGDGLFFTPYSITANIEKKSLQFDYHYLNVSRILHWGSTPDTGTQVTEFTFTLDYQNLENRAPHSVTLTLGGINYTMSPVSATDTDYVNGRVYGKIIQFLSPGVSYNHTYHVLTPDGWWHSPVINKPIIAALQLYNYSTCKLHYFDDITLTSPVSVTKLFQPIDLPFNFTFYGVNFTHLLLSRYGFIRFNTNTSVAQPIPGETEPYSRLSIAFGIATSYYWVNDGGNAVTYQLYSDKAVFVFPSMTYYYNYGNHSLGTYKIILYNSGDIVFSFLDLQVAFPGGVNLGEGVYYTSINFTQTSVPLTSTSFIFSPPRLNEAAVSGSISGALVYPYKSSEMEIFQGTYNSTGNTPVVRASVKIEGQGYNGTIYSNIINQMTFNPSGFTDYRSDTKFVLNRSLPSGIYDATITFVDIYGSKFYTSKIHFEVNDLPDCEQIPTSPYGAVGQTLTVRVHYLDPEGLAPENVTIQWDGVNYSMNPSSSEFSTEVGFIRSIVLIHGIHTFSIFVWDQIRPERVNVTINRTIDVKWLPVLEILSIPPANVLIPGEFEVKVRITSLEPGAIFGNRKVMMAGGQYYILDEVPSEPGNYTTKIPLDWGTYQFYIIVDDDYNTVTYPAEGMVTVTVINLPLILGLTIGGGAAIAIFLFVQSRRKKAQAAQYARLRRQVLAKKPTRRDIEETAEEKRKERQKEVKNLEAIDTVQPTPVPIKRSAAARRAATGAAGGAATTTAPAKVAKPTSSSGTQPKDKSGYPERAPESGTPVNRTVLKEYIERKRKEGVRELHYIGIKNDLNIISQKKSSKLYRVLQDLVKDEILVRKGSNYIIVG